MSGHAELYQRIRKVHLAERIAAQLTSDILDGRLAAGSRLPGERELSSQLGSNRNTLREAIKILEGHRLVSVRQGEGVTVLDYRERGRISLLPQYLQSGVSGGERRKALIDVLEFRRLLLMTLVRAAAERANPAMIESLRGAVSRCWSAVDDPVKQMQADLEFYRTCTEATGSVVYRWLFNTFLDVWEEAGEFIASLWVTPAGYHESLEDIVDAIARGDGDGASSRISAFLSSGDAVLLNILTIAGMTDSD